MRPQIESLEDRNLMSVLLAGETLVIQADLPAQNKAFLYLDNDSVAVNLNGQVSTFNANGVLQVVYEGGLGGGDYFEIDTNTIPSQVSLFGQGNTFSGGLEQDIVYLFGSDDYIDGGEGEDVIRVTGKNEHIYDFRDQLIL
jgi:hypothetical protein